MAADRTPGRPGTPTLHLAYYYDAPIPSPGVSAWIQILNTSRALCDLGCDVTLHTGPMRVPDAAACLALYSVPPHPGLRLMPLPARPAARAAMRRDLLDGTADRRERFEADAADGQTAGRRFVMSRGEPGLTLFGARVGGPRASGARVANARRPRLIYEAHRVSYAHYREEQAGRPPSRMGRLGQLRIAYTSDQLRRREQRTLARVDGVVCLTPGVQAALDAAFGLSGPTLILPSGTAVPPALSSIELGGARAARTRRDIDILYAGKLDRRRGVGLLLQAMRDLPGRHAWIVGGSTDQVTALRQLATALDVADRVTIPGWTPPADIAALYARARVGVYPIPAGVSTVSEQRSSPLKILEMMAHGVPVVATDFPSVQAVVTHGESALLVPPDDPAALAAAIRRVLDDSALAARLTRTARVAVGAYSWEQRAQRLYEFLVALE